MTCFARPTGLIEQAKEGFAIYPHLRTNEDCRGRNSVADGRRALCLLTTVAADPATFQFAEGGESMATEMPKTGVDAVGDVVSWGAHFCLFYETKEDLLDATLGTERYATPGP